MENLNFPSVNLGYIKKLRLDNDISIEEMSLRLGYEGYQAYYYKERGIRKMSAEDVAGIAKILSVKVDDLFFEDKVTESVISEGDKKQLA